MPFPLVTLLHISAPRAYRLLRRLQEEGKLALRGKSGRILYGAGRKMRPELYDKNTTQTGDDLCRICH